MRKAVHSVGAFILAILALFGLPKAQLVILSMTILYLASEYLRLSGRSLHLRARAEIELADLQDRLSSG